MDVAIVGAGLAGLSCAVRLENAGLKVKLLEADDAPGGRIRTDQVEGFRLDRGFQILLTGYPELANQVDLKALRLRTAGKWRSGAPQRAISSLCRSISQFHGNCA